MAALHKAGEEGRELVRVLREVLTPGAVVGEPVSVEDKVVVPVVQVSIGVGSGGGGPAEGGGGGAGCGGSITPVALVVLFKGGLRP